MGIVRCGGQAYPLPGGRPSFSFYYVWDYILYYGITVLVLFPFIYLLCTQGVFVLPSRGTPVDDAVIDMIVLPEVVSSCARSGTPPHGH